MATRLDSRCRTGRSSFTLVQQLARKQQAVTKIGEIRVETELPGVAEGSNLLRVGSQVIVLAVGDIVVVHERLGLEVRAVADAEGRVDVDHMHLPAKALLLEQAGHHQQGVASDQTVGPVVPVAVEFDRLADRRILFRFFEQRELRVCARGTASTIVCGSMRSCTCKETVGHLERRVLGLAGPGEQRIKVRIVGIAHPPRFRVGVRRHQTDRRVVRPLLAGMRVVLDVTFRLATLRRRGLPQLPSTGLGRTGVACPPLLADHTNSAGAEPDRFQYTLGAK